MKRKEWVVGEGPPIKKGKIMKREEKIHVLNELLCMIPIEYYEENTWSRRAIDFAESWIEEIEQESE